MEGKELLANMSHELRSPLNAIINFSELLINSEYPKTKQQQYLSNIAISGKHLLEIVNGILDISKADSGKICLNYEKIESSKVINETINILKPLAQKKNISLEADLQKVLLDADKKKFRQILYNLLSNSIKYTRENGSISVKSEVRNNSLKVEIIDTGIGIPLNEQGRIFERFYRLPKHDKEIEGTGLGLALTKSFIEAHNGNIYFKSEENKGTEFWFILPLIQKESHIEQEYIFKETSGIC